MSSRTAWAIYWDPVSIKIKTKIKRERERESHSHHQKEQISTTWTRQKGRPATLVRRCSVKNYKLSPRFVGTFPVKSLPLAEAELVRLSWGGGQLSPRQQMLWTERVHLLPPHTHGPRCLTKWAESTHTHWTFSHGHPQLHTVDTKVSSRKRTGNIYSNEQTMEY